MPSLNEFRIEFNRPGATYLPGEIVSGNIIVSVNKPKNIRALKFTAKGAAFVRWPKQERKRNAKGEYKYETVFYSADQSYFNVTHILLGGEGDVQLNIFPGRHIYPFTCQLPSNIPSSFEHHYGHIRYTVKAVIDRPWKFDHECKAAFTVVSILDLNAHQHACRAVTDSYKKNFYNFCCIKAGKLEGSINLPTTGFVPGQPLQAVVKFNNTSTSVKITSISMTLQQVLTFHARDGIHRDTKYDKHDVDETEILEPSDNEGEVTIEFRTPPLPPSQLQHCNIIEIAYKLKINIHVTGLHSKISRSYPVMIGSIPIRIVPSAPPDTIMPVTPVPNNEPDMPFTIPMPGPMPMPDPSSPRPSYPYPGSTGSSNAPRTSQPMGFTISDGPSIPNWNMRPPSYEECTVGTPTIREDGESNYVHGADTPFAPRYPVFQFPLPERSN